MREQLHEVCHWRYFCIYCTATLPVFLSKHSENGCDSAFVQNRLDSLPSFSKWKAMIDKVINNSCRNVIRNLSRSNSTSASHSDSSSSDASLSSASDLFHSCWQTTTQTLHLVRPADWFLLEDSCEGVSNRLLQCFHTDVGRF